jgi:hypothetical protein
MGFIRVISLFALLLLSWSSQAFFNINSDPKSLWQFREQYVRLEARENTALPNQHPVQLETAQLQRALTHVAVLKNEQMIPLFSRSELTILIDAIGRGLAKASPDEDVVFAIIGAHPGLITRENRVTTGRVFFQADRLNVVVGDVHAEIDYHQDRRLYPFVAGRRDQAKIPERPLVAQTGQTLMDQRADWVQLDLAAALPLPESHPMATMPSIFVNSAPSDTQVKMTQEIAQLKAEVAELKASETASDPVSVPTPAAAPVLSSTVEARLRELKRLRDQELISEAVYQQKQQEILRDL